MRPSELNMDEEQASAISIERAWSAVRRRMRLVVLTTGTILAASAIVIALLPVRYEATATIQVQPRIKSAGGFETSDLPSAAASGDAEIEVIGARNVLNRAIKALKLTSDSEFAHNQMGAGLVSRLRSFLSGSSSLDPQTSKAPETADPIGQLLVEETPGTEAEIPGTVIDTLASRISVKRLRSTQMFQVSAQSADPVKSASIANAVARAYLEEQIEEKRRAAGMSSSMLEEKLLLLKTRVAEAEARVEKYKADNNIYVSSGGSSVTEQQISLQVEQQVDARKATADARAKYEQAKRLIATGEGFGNMSEMLDNSSISQLKESFTRAQRRQAELETRYGPKHPELQKAKAEVSEAAAQLHAEAERHAVKLKNDYEVAAERELQLSEGMNSYKEQQVVAKQSGVTLKQLEREAETEKQLYEAMLTRYKQTNASIDMLLPDSRIVETASVPLSPESPKRLRLMLIAILGAVGAGIGLALALEFLNNGIGRPEDVERSLDLSLLSSLPAVRTESARDLSRPARLVLNEPHGVFAEAVRGVRREIDQRRTDNSPRIILVASGLPGEGSDIIASNLAHHYAMTGHSILLIDGNLRRSNLTQRLMASQTSGLREVLANGLPVDIAVLRDTVTGLHFLPASGTLPFEASTPELLASVRMTQAIEKLKSVYDTIVIDAPPLLPVIDGRILADYADQIVYVANWRRTPTQLSKRAIKSLGVNQDKIAGVVVNEVDPAVLEETQGFGAGPFDTPRPRYPHAA